MKTITTIGLKSFVRSRGEGWLVGWLLEGLSKKLGRIKNEAGRTRKRDLKT